MARLARTRTPGVSAQRPDVVGALRRLVAADLGPGVAASTTKAAPGGEDPPRREVL